MKTRLLLFMFICSFFSCRSRSSSADALAVSKAAQICCVLKSPDGYFYDTNTCKKSEDEEECCRQGFIAKNIFKRAAIGFFRYRCEDTPQYEDASRVRVCRGPTRFRLGNPVVGGISDGVSNVSQVAHVWIKTDRVEVGMGPKEWDTAASGDGPLAKLAYLAEIMRLDKRVSVTWRDHARYSDVPSSQCSQLYKCDVSCVENALKQGKSLGVYLPLNQCHTATAKVLRQCGCMDLCKSSDGEIEHCFPELRGFNLNEGEEGV